MAGTTTPRSVAAAISLGVAVLCSATPTWAAASATARSVAQPATSAGWGIVPTTSATAPATPGPLTLTFPKAPGSGVAPPQYFNAINNRSLAVANATYTLAQSDTTMVAVDACSGTWNETTGACSGTISTLVTTVTGAITGSAASPVVPAAPGAVLRLKCRPTQPSNNAVDTYTIGVQVPRSAVRAAMTTTG